MTLSNSETILKPSGNYPGDFAIVFYDAFDVASPSTRDGAVDVFMNASSRVQEYMESIVSEITGQPVYDMDEFMLRPIMLDGDEDDLHFTTPEAAVLLDTVSTSMGSGYRLGKALVPQLCEVQK